MNKPKQIKVADYSQNYGGVPVLIDNREASICSVVGYALYNNEDPVAAVQDCLEKIKSRPYDGHKLVWINVSGVCITNSPAYYERQAARRAAMPVLSTGDEIEFEGNTYQIAGDFNNNFKLIKTDKATGLVAPQPKSPELLASLLARRVGSAA